MEVISRYRLGVKSIFNHIHPRSICFWGQVISAMQLSYFYVSLLDVACNDGSSEVREVALVSLRLLCRNPSCREVSPV